MLFITSRRSIETLSHDVTCYIMRCTVARHATLVADAHQRTIVGLLYDLAIVLAL